MYIVYAITNLTGNIYIGQTDNLDVRLARHNSLLPHKKSSYTHKHAGPWKLVYKEEFETRHEALHREKVLKSYQGRVFLKRKVGPVL